MAMSIATRPLGVLSELWGTAEEGGLIASAEGCGGQGGGVEAVGIEAVAGGVGEERGAQGGAVFRLGEPEVEHGFAEGFVEVGVGDSEDEGILGGQGDGV